MDRIRQKSQHESCSVMSLEYSYKISAQLDMYNFIYEAFSVCYSVSYILFCVNDFPEIEDEFGKVLNWKVVEERLI